MADTTFIPGTVIASPWLNDVNDTVYGLLGNGTLAPVTKADVRTNLGLGTLATQNANAVAITGGTAANLAITGGSVSALATDIAIADGGTGASTAVNALANLGISPLGFSAHNNGVNQAIPSGAFTQINFSTEQFDLGGTFTASAWTPPSGRLVTISATVSLTTTAVGTVIISIYKNGVEYKRGSRFSVPAVSNDSGFTVSAIDNPNGTDVYTIRLFQSTGVVANTDGTAASTHFSGSRL